MSRIFVVWVGLALALLLAGDASAQGQRAKPLQEAQTEAPAPEPLPQPARPAFQQPSSFSGASQVKIVDTPLQVQVIEGPKTEAQYAAEQKERDDRAALADQLSIYGALLVLIGAFLAVAFGLQTFYLSLTLRAVRRAADTTERNMATAQRAFVYLTGLEWREEGSMLRITPVWANSGATPSRGLRISTNWRASHGDLPADFTYTYARVPEHLFLGPNGRSELGAVYLPMRDVQAALEERVSLYVWGRATYGDLFEGTQPHFFEFCYRVDVKGSTPNNLSVTFSQYGLRNRTDEDAQQPEPQAA